MQGCHPQCSCLIAALHVAAGSSESSWGGGVSATPAMLRLPWGQHSTLTLPLLLLHKQSPQAFCQQGALREDKAAEAQKGEL